MFGEVNDAELGSRRRSYAAKLLPITNVSPNQMSMYLTLTTGFLAAIIGSYFLYRQWATISVGGGLPLNPKGSYEFFFHALFSEEVEARRAAEMLNYPGLSAVVKPTPNDKAWAVYWSITTRAFGPKIRALQKQVEQVVIKCRGNILSISASKPNAHTVVG